MATFGDSVRRGLPRRPGGEPWPPAGVAPAGAQAVAVAEGPVAAQSPVVERDGTPPTDDRLEVPAVSSAGAGASSAPRTIHGATARAVRRGLPRVPGGEPWPPVGVVPAVAAVAESAAPAPQAAPAAPESVAAPVPPPAAPQPVAEASGTRSLRRGLPRVAGGEPWPPEGFAPSAVIVESVATHNSAAPIAETVVVEAAPPSSAAVVAPVATATGVPLSQPLPFTRTVWDGTAPRASTAVPPRAEPKRIGPFTPLQWAGAVIVGGGGLLVAGLLAVFLVRWLLSMPFGQDFLAAYPGEYHLPEGAPVGFPAWLGWQHFFNVFLMVLIIRSGLQVRTEKRPTVFWSPRSNGRRKISLNLWFHQSLDILWLVNGAIFVVLLFVTGQWMRIVPTSWEVFPNALSAALQYVSLDWPTENGWVNYNSLQQLAYFTTVFLAAPLAALTGVRMSGIWPKNATGLNKVYPVEWARAVHFPVMLYFVLFIFVHVVLVFATGALRNLNHMYAAQGSTDPDAYLMNWTGFWIFAVSMLVIVAAWIAARPLVLAPIARLFGKVSGR